MRAVILLNGEPYAGPIDDTAARVYCCDGAYRWAKERLRIDENLGDFDSLSEIPVPAPREVFPSEKNETDGELALDRAIADGADEIELYGGGGGREDHFLGNLHLLYKAHAAGVRAVMITNNARIFVAAGRVELKGCKGKTLSIIPFGADVHILKSGGLKYPLPDVFHYGSTRGISNVAKSDGAYFVAEEPALVIVNEAL